MLRTTSSHMRTMSKIEIQCLLFNLTVSSTLSFKPYGDAALKRFIRYVSLHIRVCKKDAPLATMLILSDMFIYTFIKNNTLIIIHSHVLFGCGESGK